MFIKSTVFVYYVTKKDGDDKERISLRLYINRQILEVFSFTEISIGFQSGICSGIKV